MSVITKGLLRHGTLGFYHELRQLYAGCPFRRYEHRLVVNRTGHTHGRFEHGYLLGEQ
jgi:hypothetical protein